ncbi:phosphatase PAP2 family protein [Kribbella capetownensis]|uniref:Phosphatase PAP2 family protein n=1 Tax=Kribbella capetownensis TaxID=1572659 RepID=A0A4R0JWS2_9ACTN|nr:phosphatase PAP2 family protein [Kribbella capetownensis]TCC50664.1 phosphatase PAP2 family protein [Kribbella capetownensis]
MTSLRASARAIAAHLPWRTILGLLAITLGIIAFVVLADAAVEGDALAGFDPSVTRSFIERRTPQLSTAARGLTFIGEVPVLTGLTIVVAALLRILTRRWKPAVILTVGMIGAATLTYSLKVLIGRHRPDAEQVLGTVNHGFSFPSGHALSSTVFFLLLAGMLWYSKAARSIKIVGTTVAIGLSIAIGLSRIYLGYHWATDVLAGWTMAFTWLSVLATAIHLIETRRGGGAAEPR